MSSSLAYSEIDTNNTNNTNKEGDTQKNSQQKRNNATIRRRPQINKPNNQNVSEMLKIINDTNGYESIQDNSDESELVDFNPPPRPTLNNKNPTFEGIQNQNKITNNGVNNDIDSEQPVIVTQQKIDQVKNDTTQQVVQNRVYPQPMDSYEGYQDMPKNYSKQFYKNYVPYFNQNGYTNLTSNSNQNKDQLLEKLNYMIHLLEEQKDEKTGHVIEEVILYSFLGIFIIFIVDSFARAGKYTR
jgi:hypothetical protein